MNIDESHFSDEYQPVIRKLREAYESKQVRVEMQMEDDYINELRINAEIIAENEKIIAENEIIIAEKDKTLAEKDKSLAEKEEIIAEDKKSLAEKDKEIEDLKRLLGK